MKRSLALLLVLAIMAVLWLAAAPALAVGLPGASPPGMTLDVDRVAILAIAIWAVTGIATRLLRWDGQAVALGLAMIGGIAALYTGYLHGPPVEVLAKILIALFGANLTHDKVSKPVGAGVSAVLRE